VDTAVYVRKLLPRKMAKYWLQRYSLFSRFDMGAQMDVQVRRLRLCIWFRVLLVARCVYRTRLMSHQLMNVVSSVHRWTCR
jgi:hypothetical protein